MPALFMPTYNITNPCTQHVKIHQEPKYDTFTIEDESTINIAQVYGHGVLVVSYSIIAPLSFSRNSS